MGLNRAGPIEVLRVRIRKHQCERSLVQFSSGVLSQAHFYECVVSLTRIADVEFPGALARFRDFSLAQKMRGQVGSYPFRPHVQLEKIHGTIMITQKIECERT